MNAMSMKTYILSEGHKKLCQVAAVFLFFLGVKHVAGGRGPIRKLRALVYLSEGSSKLLQRLNRNWLIVVYGGHELLDIDYHNSKHQH
jgi:hypothetical protein